LRLLRILTVSLLFTFSAFSQNKKFTYIQFDVAIPIKGNPELEETVANGSKNSSWFLPDGLNTKIGYGVHYNKWIALGINSGMTGNGPKN
jgi:hypothetical protein